MASWIVGGLVVGESAPGLWVKVKRVLLPDDRTLSRELSGKQLEVFRAP